MFQIDIEELRRKVEIKELLARKGELTESEAAYFLDIEVKKLKNWRGNGKGPIYTKFEGEVRYPVTSLNHFKTQGLRNPGGLATGVEVALPAPYTGARRGRKPKKAV